jgi:hypothetical protein
MGIGSVFSFLFAIGVIVGLFILLREIVLWYWKINEHIEIAKESRDYLKEIAAATTYLARQVSAEQAASHREIV